VLGGVRLVVHGRVNDDVDGTGEAEEVRSALEWAQVRALAADGVSLREIARRLGIGRNTVGRLVEAQEQPRYSRAPGGVPSSE
jgi:transposase